MNAITEKMRDRVAKGLDPLTGDPMVTKGAIRWATGPDGEDLHRLVDDTGRRVALDARGNWVYA